MRITEQDLTRLSDLLRERTRHLNRTVSPEDISKINDIVVEEVEALRKHLLAREPEVTY